MANVIDFKNALMREFIRLCRGNDFNKLSLLKIGETVDRVLEAHYRNFSTEEAPAVDAVEVVRCKDCKQWNCVTKPAFYDKRHGYCLNDDEPIGRWEDGFCSYGERKGNE